MEAGLNTLNSNRSMGQEAWTGKITSTSGWLKLHTRARSKEYPMGY